jgi:predicted ATPase/class 3 adenylate cyclase/DNA-binding SARP family transcriptional activator
VADLGVGAGQDDTAGQEPATGALRISVLGPLAATAGGRALALGGPLPHRLVVALVVERGAIVADEHLIKRVWCDDWATAEELDWEPYRERLRVTVSRLNGVLPPAGDGPRIQRRGQGYRLVVGDDELDLFAFDRRREQAADALAANQPARAARFAGDALALWRGRPFGRLGGEHFVQPLAEELEKQLLRTQETKAEALLHMHGYSEALPVARALVDAEPDNEHWLALLVRSLYGSGRADKALTICQDYVARLARVTGRTPQGELADLEARMLCHDPSLVAPATAPGRGPGGDRADSPKTFLVTSVDHGRARAGPRPRPGDEALATYQSEVKAAVAANRGFVFEESPHGYRAVFENPLHAVLAARDLARAVRSSPGPAGRLPVTAAVHTGVAEERGNVFTGPPVVHVARLRDACHPGQVLVSEATRALVTDNLPLGLRLREVAPWQSDAAAEPERRYQLVHPDLPADFPPLRTGTAPVGQTPTSQSEFIGRPDEVADVAARLEDGRLVTITGQGGVGKTRLAVEVGERVTPRYPDGVRYCDVSLADDADALVGRLAEILGLARETGRDQRDDVVRALRTARLLLVLDGCEHLRTAVAALAGEVLASDGETRLLATSQARLELPGEQVVSLDTLALPDSSDPRPDEAPAVQLLVLRARRAGARLVSADPTVVELARRLGGLPLAIELIAVHLVSTPAATVVERLDHYIGEASGPSVGPGPDRHRTLRATFDWSFNLASPAARRLLASTSIFRGTWSLAQAESLAAAVDVEPERVIALTAELANLSIVRADLQPGGTGRYRMLDTIRSFAAEHLAELGRVDAVADLHADHFLQLAEEAARHRRGPDEAAWVAEVDAEIDNLRAAYRHLADRGRPRDALRLVVALGDDLLMRERLEIGRWAADMAADPALAAEPLRVVALGLAANAVMLQGRLDEAERLAREALATEAALPGAPPPWMAHNVLAIVKVAAFDDGWVDHIHAMEQTSDAMGDPFPRALALWNRVFLAEYTDRVAYAEAAAPELLALGDKHDNPSIRSMGLWARGRVAAMLGDYGRARDLFQQALGVAEAARNTLMVNKTLRALADLVADLGHPRAALDALCRIARSFRSTGNVSEQAQTARSIVEYLVAIGEVLPAARALARLQRSPLKEASDFGAFVDSVMDRLTPDERDRVQREGAAIPLHEVISDLIRVVDALPDEDPHEEPAP